MLKFRKIPFTPQHLKAYQEQDFNACFVCNGGKLDGSEGFDMFLNEASHFVDCEDCKSKWTEKFKYVEREDIDFHGDVIPNPIKGYPTNQCHKCRSTNTQPYTDMDYTGGMGEEAYCRVECNDCQSRWRAYYKFETIEDLEIIQADSVHFIQED